MERLTLPRSHLQDVVNNRSVFSTSLQLPKKWIDYLTLSYLGELRSVFQRNHTLSSTVINQYGQVADHYTSTFHSAGHIILFTLTWRLRTASTTKDSFDKS